MNEKEKEHPSHSVKSLYGIEPEMSLQSVNFAPPENSLLNEQYEEEDPGQE